MVINSDLAIRALDPDTKIAEDLIRDLDRYLLDLYPVESNHLDSIEELSQPYVHLLGAFENDRALGCGAVKLLPDGYAEIKRIFVSTEARGKGVGRALLCALEKIAVDSGYSLLRLETGVHQPEALRLFETNGFVRTNRFGKYPDDPLSVFMEKRLT